MGTSPRPSRAPGPAARAARELAGLASVALLAAAALGAAGLAAKLAVCLAAGRTELVGHLLVSWRTVIVLPLGLGGRLLRGLGPPRGAPVPRARSLAQLAATAAVVVAAAVQAPKVFPNAFGWDVSPPGGPYWIDRGHPYRPPAAVTFNAHGFRDREWTPAPAFGTTRVVFVGDSYVFGSGIPQVEGTVTRQLEAALRADFPGRRWEVLNAGNPGWGLVTYFQVARRLVRELRPAAVVIGSLGWTDWDLLENGQLFARLGPTGYRVLGALGAVADVREASILGARDARRTWERTGRAPGEALVAGALDDLLREARGRGVPVLIWEWHGRMEFLDRWDGRPGFLRVRWPPGMETWDLDPVLAIPGDGHPTAEGNRLAADVLAPAVAAAVAGAPVAAAEGSAR